MKIDLLLSLLRAVPVVIIPFGIWLIGYFGASKTWYFRTSISSLAFGVARFWYYVMPFVGIAFLCFAISDWQLGQDRNSLSVWLFIGVGCVLLGFLCGFLQPAWLSPRWLRRLKHQHGDVLPKLIDEAAGMDRDELQQRLKNDNSLQQWIAEVRRKYR